MGTPLKDWDIVINYGIKTGFNDAFIITDEKRKELIAADPKSVEVLRPILRGRDIKKYECEFADLWLIYIPWHFPLHENALITGASDVSEKAFSEQFPAIYSHLFEYKAQLSARNKAETGVRYEWYALQRWGANYKDDFDKQKIVWKRVGSVIRFAYDKEGTFCLDSTCFATGSDLKFLVGFLNSTISRKILLDNSPKTGTGDVITSVQALEPLLVPNASFAQKREIEILVDQYIDKLSSGSNSGLMDLDEKIDKKILALFNFEQDETDYIFDR